MSQRPNRKTVEMFDISSCDKGERKVQEEASIVVEAVWMRAKRDVGRFIEQHGLDKKNAKKLKEASDDVAGKVMMNGIATTARDPSA